MKLQDLLYKVKIISVQGSTDVDVAGLSIDSRDVKKEYAFIAIKGAVADGYQFIDAAISNGATIIISAEIPAQTKAGVTYVGVQSPAAAAGMMADAFYASPSSLLKVIGVTGTNGKTTVTTLLHNLFTGLGFACGLTGTVENRIGDKIIPATHTTPDAISFHRLLREMASAGCEYVFAECSSHAIEQNRLAGIKFAGAVFTNITHDHLDYHKTFDEYIRVKKSWFDELPADAFALSNADDKRGAVMLQNTKAKKLYYSLRTVADFKGKILDDSIRGLHMSINDIDAHFRLPGMFNAYNLLAVYGVAIRCGLNKEDVLPVLSSLRGAEGRFDVYESAAENITGIIDYAHTPDALLNVLATIRHMKRGPEKLITVVGCGGNRDKTKRPLMAKVAVEYSDKVILTSDNPRNEDPEQILRDMEEGINAAEKRKVLTVTDRRQAIKTAISLSAKDDIVLVAGKGHEKYQEINGVKHAFDDRRVLEEMFGLLEK